MEIPLSNYDIFKIANKRCNMFSYPQLSEIYNIDDLFSEDKCIINKILDNDDSINYIPFDNNSCLILYKTSDDFGHWCLINRNTGRYDFFDSYGEIVDDQLDHINNKYRKISNQIKTHLTNILDKARNTIHYNNIALQKKDGSISTCGRYCSLYIKYNKVPVEDFTKKIIETAKDLNITNDELVVLLTRELYLRYSNII